MKLWQVQTELPAVMVALGCLVESVLIVDVWKSVSLTCGELFVMTCGQLLMPEWPADSWDTQGLVRSAVCNLHVILSYKFITPPSVTTVHA